MCSFYYNLRVYDKDATRLTPKSNKIILLSLYRSSYFPLYTLPTTHFDNMYIRPKESVCHTIVSHPKIKALSYMIQGVE